MRDQVRLTILHFPGSLYCWNVSFALRTERWCIDIKTRTAIHFINFCKTKLIIKTVFDRAPSGFLLWWRMNYGYRLRVLSHPNYLISSRLLMTASVTELENILQVNETLVKYTEAGQGKPSFFFTVFNKNTFNP